METPYGASVTPIVPDTYNPNALIQYKDIDGEQVTFPITKVVDLEWLLEGAKRSRAENYRLSNLIDGLDDKVIEWVNPNYSKEDVIRELCEYFGISPVKQVVVTGTISFELTVDVPLDEVEDFDAHYYLQDELVLDSHSSSIDINTWSIENSNVDWD